LPGPLNPTVADVDVACFSSAVHDPDKMDTDNFVLHMTIGFFVTLPFLSLITLVLYPTFPPFLKHRIIMHFVHTLDGNLLILFTKYWLLELCLLKMFLVFPSVHIQKPISCILSLAFGRSYATDTYFSDTSAHDNFTCVQLYFGRKSFFTAVFGMKTER